MLGILIKNNLKLMFRSKLILALVFIAPIVVIGALSSAFDGLLESDYQFEEIKIGYAVQKDSLLDTFLTENKEAYEEEKLIMASYDVADGKSLVTSKQIDVFVEETEEELIIYSCNASSIPTKMCQYVLDQFYTEYGNGYRQVVFEQLQTATGTATGTDLIVDFQTGELEGLTLSPAGNYYGIIEIVYFMSFSGMLFLTAIVQSERKNRIARRFVASPAHSFVIFLSKWIPAVIMEIISTTVSAIISTFLFDVSWKNWMGSVGILFLGILAGSSIGIALLYLVNHLAVSVILVFTISWVAGFIGGSFETYMFCRLPQFVQELSPTYYLNRTLVEYSTMGYSDYTGKCILITLGMTIVFGVIGSLMMKKNQTA